ncbi:hypothetical protein [Tumebacillus flagellatus]|uniref:Uncharacterized protein n=1 Tax=Tumebacillus flagellatus TaxID=1157490 RepID=A0A074LI09_9BACL|nr:hypothetical protein [Tumebacillus flagellatus]KEO80784.1 hypothetical protein EL26_24480 [Tumebacillus flagellatus]
MKWHAEFTANMGAGRTGEFSAEIEQEAEDAYRVKIYRHYTNDNQKYLQNNPRGFGDVKNSLEQAKKHVKKFVPNIDHRLVWVEKED